MLVKQAMAIVTCLVLLIANVARAAPGTDIRTFGAKCDGSTDDYAAFTAAAVQGGLITVPAGVCRLSSTLHLTNQIILQGEGGGGDPTTILSFDPGVSGVVINRYNTGGAADWSSLRDLGIHSQSPRIGTAEGVWLRARAELHNVSVRGFGGNGVRIEASYAFTPPTNANNWSIIGGRFAGNGGDGLYVHGDDTNAGRVEGLDASENEGWGIRDASFLGNTYIGCHTATNKAGGYYSQGVNARTVFLGCYSEQDQPPSQIQWPSLVVGGLHGAGISGTAMDLRPDHLSALRAEVKGPGPGKAGLGSSDSSSAYLELKPDAESHPTRLKYGSAFGPGFYAFNWANTNGYDSLLLSGPNAVFLGRPIPPAFSVFPRGFFAGSHRIETSATVPSSGAYKKGDVVLANDPLVLGAVGWVCVADGTPGTWRVFGMLAP